MIKILLLHSDEFPSVWNKIALEIYRASPDFPISDLAKSWVRAHHFASHPSRGSFLRSNWFLPITVKITYRQTDFRKIRNCQKNRQMLTILSFCLFFLPLPSIRHRAGNTTILALLPWLCCKSSAFRTTTNPASHGFSFLLSQSFESARRFYRNLFRFLGQSAEVV